MSKYNILSHYFILPVLLLLLTSVVACEKDEGDDEVIPVDTSSYPATGFKTLDYLYRISGTRTLSGIHNREPNSKPAQWTDQIYTTTQKYPALWSGDFLFQAENIDNRQVMVDEALKQWKRGAVVNLMWHACNPALSEPCEWNQDGVLSQMTDTQWNELLTDGTAINSKWKAMMDDVAVYLQFLEDNGVEVLWRPLHEMNQRAFWWGGRPGANGTRKLYQLTHDYFKNAKGLTNLIWVWDLQDFESLPDDVTRYNPGDAYWDVLALDLYDGGSGYSTLKYTTIVQAANGKPIGIGECQDLPTIAELIAQRRWTFFMSWSELTFESNTDQEIKTLYNGAYILTLDEMPGWE
ncbi:MAG TPA: glycosyl hydrolase [Ohtaekwangia sp.]|nr:glycosyl hydrolase [Ohtaekwangia sp.]